MFWRILEPVIFTVERAPNGKEVEEQGVWGARTMTSTFCCGKGCVNKTWKSKRKLCALYEVLQVPDIQSPRVLQVTLYKTWKSQGDWVGKRLIKEWEEGGCERNFNVFVCVWDKSLSTFLHLALLCYFSGIADLELGWAESIAVPWARWFSSLGSTVWTEGWRRSRAGPGLECCVFTPHQMHEAGELHKLFKNWCH